MINVYSTPDTFSSTGGVKVLVGKIFSEVGFTTATKDVPDTIRRALASLAGLHIQERTRFAEIEQFYSELKTDMNVERLPSGKFSVNAIILHTAMIACNTLRLIGQTALQFPALLPYRHKGKRKRLRKVIDDLIRISCKVVSHAHRLVMKLWVKDPWYELFRKLSYHV